MQRTIDRRAVLAAGAAALAGPAVAQAKPVVWSFTRPDKVGGVSTEVLGEPRPVAGPGGKALAFDGQDDGLVVPLHPLAGAAAFTIEAVVRPDGGRFEQRWLHLAQDAEDAGVSGGTRMLFEVRVVEDAWYLDAFVKGPGYSQTLIAPERRHPVGRWAHVAQVCDGRTYACFVDGALQAQAEIAFRPQGAGRTSVGVRLNRVDWFQGAIREARFTPAALTPAQFSRPAGLLG
jgi:hypothetical protein